MKSKLANLGAFMMMLALQVAVVWQDASAPLAGKLAATFVSALALAITAAKLKEIEQVLIAACVVAGTIGTIVLGHLSGRSAWATVGSVVLNTILQVRNLLSQDSAKNVAVTVLLAVGVSLAGCAWWQKHEGDLACAGIVTVQDGPQLIEIVVQCAAIAVSTDAILPCIEGAAGSAWASDVVKCFAAASQGKATCPAFAQEKAAGAARLSAQKCSPEDSK